MAQVAAESLRGVLGASFEYVFSNSSDVNAYRVARRQKLNWREEWELAVSTALFVGAVAYFWITEGWRSGTFMAFLIGLIVSLRNDHHYFFKPYSRLELTIHPTWIGLTDGHSRKKRLFRPFSNLVWARQVQSIDWIDGGCLVRRKWFVFRPTYIDGRLLAQHGAIDAICEWANRHGIEMTGRVPVLSAE